jgi:mono/diheme cytochrome c family protein
MAGGVELVQLACPKKCWISRSASTRVKEERRVNMFLFRSCLPLVLLVPVVTFAADPPVIKKVPVVATSPISGSEMFREYCASCHGADARGHGPAVRALKVPPPDLTLLSRNNHGKFPDQLVYVSIKGDVNLPSHGSKDMPVWGTIFHEMAAGGIGETQVAFRMRNLCLYIESLQQK